MKNKTLNKKLLLISFFIFIMAIGAIFFYSSIQNDEFEEDIKTSSNYKSKTPSKLNLATIPANYSQDLDLDGVYEYNVTQFGEVESWWYYYEDRGYWKTDSGGKVKINFTGFYNRDPRDFWGDEFPDTNMPYYDIEIFNSTHPTPIFQENNLSNSEVGGTMCIGHNGFNSGFLIPNDNLTHIKKIAIEQADGYTKGEVIVEETFNFLYISFESYDKLRNSYLLYERSTGLLVWANITSYSGYKLEIYSLNFTFNLDTTFNYTIKEFGESISWFNLTNDFKGYANTNATGIINVNFTGKYEKDVNDNSIFNNPIPWINITFIENTTGVLIINNTLYNVSNSEVALNLHIGFNNFSSGFLIPTDNLTRIKEKAILEGSGENVDGFLRIEETGLTIKFIFIETGGVNFSATTYDKRTGLLMWIKAISGNFSLEMELVLSYQESDPIPPPDPYTKTVYITDVSEKKGDTEFENFTIPFVLLACGAAASFSLLVWKRDIKMLKYLLTGIFGTICFSSLLVYTYWLTTGVASIDEKSDETALEVVEEITLIVDFGDGTVKTWKDFTLTEGKTSVLDALEKNCDIKYEDYGWGILVTEIDGVEGDWIYEVNGEQPGHGADRHYLRDGDTIEWILV